MDRLGELKTRLFQEFYVKKEWWGDDLAIPEKDRIAAKPISLRKAIAFEMVCREMPIEIRECELIVGIPTMSSVGFGHTFPKYETDMETDIFSKISLSRKSVWGHHMPYYPRVLGKGFSGIAADVDAVLSANPSLDLESMIFYEGCQLALRAAAQLPKRYAEQARYLAGKTKDLRRKSELEEIGRVCARVPNEPAMSFHEALQSVWFTHLILHSTLDFTPLGRIDQYLWPYYSRDLAEGRISREYARELLGSFLVKFSERTQFNREHMENHLGFGDWSQGGDPEEPTAHFDMENEMDYTFGQSANHWLQSATVGGFGTDGADGTNELSAMIIELVNELELATPMICARLHKDSPPDFLDTISRALSKGGAQPTLFNDETIIPGLVRDLNLPIEDARDYSSDGCWEVIIQGRTEYGYGHIELMPCIEAVFNHGRSLASGKKVGIDLGDAVEGLKNYDDFYKAFLAQMKYRMDCAIKNKLRYYDEVHKIAPEPFLSALIENCIEKGRDLTLRGAKHRIYSFLATGVSHCVDSLTVIKKYVFEEKQVSLADLIAAIRSNWTGFEKLRQKFLNKAPKYGNDDDYADAVLGTVMTDFCDYADEWGKKIDWLRIGSGVATFENYPRFGHNAAASCDGRFDHEAFSSNYSPAVGRDRNGPTAVMKSATKFDLTRLSTGCPVDMKISFTHEEDNKASFILGSFIKSFLELGGNMMTISMASVATLKAAQKEPEKYKSLRVRLGGVTAYFVQLAREQQDEYIRRTEHGF